LAEGSSECGILYAQLINQGTTFFPTSVGLVGRCEGGVQELGARLESFNMSSCGIREKNGKMVSDTN
jgi:hypothetical protein